MSYLGVTTTALPRTWAPGFVTPPFPGGVEREAPPLAVMGRLRAASPPLWPALLVAGGVALVGLMVLTRDAPRRNPRRARRWIQGAIRRPGALRDQLRRLGRFSGEGPIPARTLQWASRQPGVLGRRARLAMTLRRF